jgi:ATP-dependent Clp protease ATP-binding subunit ClpA
MTREDLFQKVTKEELLEQGYFMVGYDLLYQRLCRIITKKGINNAIIVGEEGVGKSRVGLGLAFKGGYELLKLQTDILSEIIFSYQVDKDILNKIKKIFRELNNTIIFIDDFSLLFSTEHLLQQRFTSLINLLLDNHKVSVVATIDQVSFRQFIEKDPLISKAFEVIRVNEPNAEMASQIVKNYLTVYRKMYKIKIADKLAPYLVTLSNRYIHSKKQPAKALNLLDEVCAYGIDNNKEEIALNDIKFIISERTGIPIDDINLSDMDKLQRLDEILSSTVKGQDHAVQKVVRVIRRSRSGIKDPRRPIGSFLFIGPSGVGKTFLAKTLAKTVYDDENALIRIDMSEFSESHNVQRLVGAPPGYIGYEEGGQLTNPIWERPYSLILLDEIEKAHPRVFDIFLQVVDEGRLTDGQGKTVDFNNTIIIATSNIGVDYLIEKYESLKEGIFHDEFIREEIIPILLSHFRPEFINRFDEIVIFTPLQTDDLKDIAKQSIDELNDRLKDKEIQIEVNDELLERFALENYHPKFGARPIKRAIRENIEDIIAQKMIFGEIEKGSKVVWE